MPIFISYSQNDSTLVDRIVADIVKTRSQVWLDRWDLRIGDSLVNKIESAIATSSAVVVVLSKSSVTSEWCKKELTASLMRELKEQKVLILPVLIEDCEVPEALQDKLYADFREDYTGAMNDLLDAIAQIDSTEQGRLETPASELDWALDWSTDEDGLFHFRFIMVDKPKELPITLLVEVEVKCNEAATRRQREFADVGLEWFGRLVIAEGLADIGDTQELFMLLENQFPRDLNIEFADSGDSARGYAITVTGRRLGTDVGGIQLIRVSNYLRTIVNYLKEVSRTPSDEEGVRIANITQMRAR